MRRMTMRTCSAWRRWHDGANLLSRSLLDELTSGIGQCLQPQADGPINWC